ATQAAAAAQGSVTARLRSCFAGLGHSGDSASHRGASMPALRRASMAPPSVRRNPLQWFKRVLTGKAGQRRRPAARKRHALAPVLRLRQCVLAVLVFVPAIGATAYMATVLPHGGSTWLELIILAAALLLFAWI